MNLNDHNGDFNLELTHRNSGWDGTWQEILQRTCEAVLDGNEAWISQVTYDTTVAGEPIVLTAWLEEITIEGGLILQFRDDNDNRYRIPGENIATLCV